MGEKKFEVAEKQSEIFMNTVMRAFNTGNIEIKPTQKQQELVQAYFIEIDKMLGETETKRLQKNANNSDPKYNNNLPYVWANVNVKQLALDVMRYSKMGLDIQQKNMIHAIPYKDNANQKYNINLMRGYNGIRYIAEKYALDKPKNVICELVYETDTFRIVKKDAVHDHEGYEFQINNPFDRGKLLGGFGYYEYHDPAKNRLVFMTLKDIEKRKPEKASGEFWGGKKTVYENNKRVTVDTDGWYEEMCLKTLKRFVYSEANIPIDPAKIDENYEYIKKREMDQYKEEVNGEIRQNANQQVVDADFTEKEHSAKTIENDAHPELKTPAHEAAKEPEPVIAVNKKTEQSADPF
ncbi:recombinase RecT [Thomasclavelia cocleata]|uniref:recombinase RecT n=1 Tax=Thomasclavelia cocleata TaxID=69824 RepID=UPI00257820B0|nr:recombinase RecT [Thomasclavelia cocleata]